jgi:hypothetical protein
MPANSRWDLIQRLNVKIVKNSGNGRLNNLNDPNRPQCVKKNPGTQRHVPEELNPQQHRCENLKSHRFFFHPTKIIYLYP